MKRSEKKRNEIMEECRKLITPEIKEKIDDEFRNRLRWESGNRSFNWDESDIIPNVLKRHPLCLQSREYNRDMKGRTWVYYSKTDAKKLYKFLKKIFENS